MGLSVSVPQRDLWKEEAQDQAAIEFVSVFCASIFQAGGRIVQALHPVFTPVVLGQLRDCFAPVSDEPSVHGGKFGARKRLILVMSGEDAKTLLQSDRLTQYGELAQIIVVEEDGKHPARRKSDMLLRCLVQNMNVLVVVGAAPPTETSREDPEAELRLARKRGMPCFFGRHRL